MTAAARRLTVAVAALAALSIFLSGGHRNWRHWDEPVYLFAAARYTPAALAAGVFEPGDFGGFFAAKIGHVALLRGLMQVFGQDVAALPWLMGFYTLLVIMTAALVLSSYRGLWRDTPRALAAALVALLTPVMVYLGPKLLSEVPAMAAGMASLCLFVPGTRQRSRLARLLLLMGSAACVAIALACRGTVLLMVGGCWVAMWAAPPEGLHRRQIVEAAAIVSALTLLLLAVSQPLLGVNLLRAISSVQGATKEYEPWWAALKRTLYALGPALALVPVALLSRRRREMVFALVWLCCSIGPLLIGLHRLEERFLVTGVPALAGLAVLGGEVLVRWGGLLRHRALSLTAVAAALGVLAFSNGYIQPRTLWELNTDAYAEAMQWITRTAPQRPILVPWAIGDFHYLQFAYPSAPVYLADTKAFCRFTTLAGQVEDSAACVARIHRWYGTHWVGDAVDLAQLGEPPWWYLTKSVLGRDTEDHSWVWQDPTLRVVPVHRNGRYRVYEVEPRG